jgi:hypothetical protein
MGIIISSLSLNNERGIVLMLLEKRDEIVRQASEKVRIYMPFHHSCSIGVNHALPDAFGIRDEGLFKAALAARVMSAGPFLVPPDERSRYLDNINLIV